MSKSFEEYLKEILKGFDLIDLGTKYYRRLAVKPLYDYCQIVVLEVAVHLCGSDRNSLKSCHLKTRWNIIKNYLEVIESPSKWDSTILELYGLRSKVEHNDYYEPDKAALTRIRKFAPEFYNWILKVGRQYNEKIGKLPFVKNFLITSELYLGKVDWILHVYGEQIPYSGKGDIVISGEEHPYRRLKPLSENLRLRILEIRNIDNLKKEDLDNLVELVKLVERLDAQENLLLQSNTCPKCGGKIVETRRKILGGNPEDPIPYAVSYRVGCEKCNYELTSETINI